MDVASYGPGLGPATEQIHIHHPECLDPKRKPIYRGQTRVIWHDVQSLRDIVTAEYPPGEFEYEPSEWRDFSGDIRVFPCVGDLPDEVVTHFHIKITLGNDAMSTPEDVAAALDDVAARLRDGRLSGPVRDANGNEVGSFEFEQ